MNILIQNELDFSPKISVIIPVYNTEKYLRECLESVINQSLKEIEIICVDDGSSDKSLEILQEFAARDKRISVLTQQNLYAGVARNAGMIVAKGEYLHFMDSDDWLEAGAYQILSEKIKNFSPEIIKFNHTIYDELNDIFYQNDYAKSSEIDVKKFNKFIKNPKYELLFKLPISPWSGVYKAEFLKEFKIKFDDLECANDVSFFYQCIKNLKNIFIMPNSLYIYRKNHRGTLSKKRDFNAKFIINALLKVAALNDEKITKNLLTKTKKQLISLLNSDAFVEKDFQKLQIFSNLDSDFANFTKFAKNRINYLKKSDFYGVFKAHTSKSNGFNIECNASCVITFRMLKSGKLCLAFRSKNENAVIFNQIFLNEISILQSPIIATKDCVFRHKQNAKNKELFCLFLKTSSLLKDKKSEFIVQIRNAQTSKNDIEILDIRKVS